MPLIPEAAEEEEAEAEKKVEAEEVAEEDEAEAEKKVEAEEVTTPYFSLVLCYLTRYSGHCTLIEYSVLTQC